MYTWPILDAVPLEYFYSKIANNFQGWMNEIDIYDPETYHITMTRSVYVKLEGKIDLLLRCYHRVLI